MPDEAFKIRFPQLESSRRAICSNELAHPMAPWNQKQAIHQYRLSLRGEQTGNSRHTSRACRHFGDQAYFHRAVLVVEFVKAMQATIADVVLNHDMCPKVPSGNSGSQHQRWMVFSTPYNRPFATCSSQEPGHRQTRELPSVRNHIKKSSHGQLVKRRHRNTYARRPPTSDKRRSLR